MIYEILRKLRLYVCRVKIRSKDLGRTIICNNCLGGILYHDLGMRFNSPFINLMIPTSQYVDLLKNLYYIGDFDLVDATPKGCRYPIGLLHSKYELHFMHYNSFEEAKRKWEERVKRINYESLYVILVETHSSTYQDLVNFDNLPFQNKILITHKPFPEIKCSVPIKGYDGKNLNGEIFGPMNRWGKTIYDQIDWLTFLDLK